MGKETLAELTTDEFNQLLEGYLTRADDRIEPSAFLSALAELEQHEIELSGSVVT